MAMNRAFIRRGRARGINPGQAQAQKALRSQKTYVSFPYYSLINFGTTLTGAGPYVYTVAANTELQAFGYANGADMAVAGQSGVTATYADTNIQTAGQTIAGQTVRIQGISLQIVGLSNPRLAAALWPNVSCRVTLNGGTQNLFLGTPNMLPGGSGLYGGGEDNTGTQAIAGGRPTFLHFTNGLPGVANMSPVPEGLVWRPQGKTDSNLKIIFRTERAVTVGAVADEAAAAGIRGYAHPAAADVYVRCMVRLHGIVSSPRSQNI